MVMRVTLLFVALLGSVRAESCANGAEQCDAPEEVEEVAAIAIHSVKRAKVTSLAGPGTHCTYGHQFCDYYGCQVRCPANGVCPSHIGCTHGSFCTCGQNGETVPCPASGVCPGKHSLAQEGQNSTAGPGTHCIYGHQFCDYYGCQVRCPADGVCPSHIGCTHGSFCTCGQNGETVPCPASGVCPGKHSLAQEGQSSGARELSSSDASVAQGVAENSLAGPGTHCTYGHQFCDYYGCQVRCPANGVCPSHIGCTHGSFCTCGQNGETVPCPASGVCPGKHSLAQEGQNSTAGPGTHCTYGSQFCDHYGCQVPCPADGVCPEKIGCAQGSFCACGQNGETKPCPACGDCPR